MGEAFSFDRRAFAAAYWESPRQDGVPLATVIPPVGAASCRDYDRGGTPLPHLHPFSLSSPRDAGFQQPVKASGVSSSCFNRAMKRAASAPSTTR